MFILTKIVKIILRCNQYKYSNRDMYLHIIFEYV